MTTRAKLIKIGNSQGVRLSRAALTKMDIKEGDWVEVTIKRAKPNTQKAIAALEAIAKLNGTLANLDVQKWEADRHREWEEREAQLRALLGR